MKGLTVIPQAPKGHYWNFPVLEDRTIVSLWKEIGEVGAEVSRVPVVHKYINSREDYEVAVATAAWSILHALERKDMFNTWLSDLRKRSNV